MFATQLARRGISDGSLSVEYRDYVTNFAILAAQAWRGLAKARGESPATLSVEIFDYQSSDTLVFARVECERCSEGFIVLIPKSEAYCEGPLLDRIDAINATWLEYFESRRWLPAAIKQKSLLPLWK